ncbi:peptidylprolyl isomerase [Lyngbya confervoides]|uniref:peptidylprolyl isomerase n=1 Tax=Lyngbya confervoides BDU141951 TaxID=1574623 RepID=A0ABD4T686_9CYAN|nr:peptidylprolyl isomerase [Lyngbya confervoides]MCM1983953.1 peptidylprolyl isomerase [Lyngbya confervoides BDU141951]
MDLSLTPLIIAPQDILSHLKQSCQMPQILRAIARQKLIEQSAQDRGIHLSVEQLQAGADRLRAQHKLWGTAETQDWLQRHALTLDDFERLIRHQLLADALAIALFTPQLEAYFHAHQKDYTEVVFYEIAVQDADLALELYYALQEGEISFVEAAERYALDPEDRYRGGYRGKMRGQDLPAVMATAVYAADSGQLLRPIAIGRDFHLVFVVEKIVPDLNPALRQEILGALLEDWVDRQLQQISLELADDFGA